MAIIVDFTKKMFSTPWIWRIWLMCLIIANMIFPLIFIGSHEAQWTLGAFTLSFLTGLILFKSYGFSKIVGLMHWPWIPLTFFLLAGMGQTQAASPFGMWLRLVLILNSISIILDANDVIRYCAGDKKPI